MPNTRDIVRTRIHDHERDEISRSRDGSTHSVARILIIGSQPSFASRISLVFSGAGFLLRQIHGASGVLALLGQFQPDVAIVEFAGWSEARRALFESARGLNSPPPTLVLSTHHDSVEKATALNGGADGHATVTADADELRAEVRALMRRSKMAPMAVRVGSIELSAVHREVRCVAGSVQLSPSECSLLHLIMTRAGSTVPRQLLQERLGRNEQPCSEDACKQVVRSVRRKLERIGAGDCLLTVVGHGYRLDT